MQSSASEPGARKLRLERDSFTLFALGVISLSRTFALAADRPPPPSSAPAPPPPPHDLLR
jgi:hypothetical protein